MAEKNPELQKRADPNQIAIKGTLSKTDIEGQPHGLGRLRDPQTEGIFKPKRDKD